MAAANRRGGGGHGGGGGGGHDASGGMRWLLTYADMITLLLALFIYLFSISTVDVAKLQAFATSFMTLFGMGPSPTEGSQGVSPVPGISRRGSDDTPIKRGGEGRHRRSNENPPAPPMLPVTPEQEAQALSHLRSQLESVFPELLRLGKLTFLESEEGLVLRIQDTALFALGSSEVTPQAREILDTLAYYLTQLPNPIRVEGHTDDLPVRSLRFRSNWELSGNRAASVVKGFIADGIAADRLSLAGYAEFRPIAKNVPGKGNALNRRVEILILSMHRISIPLTPPSAAPASVVPPAEATPASVAPITPEAPVPATAVEGPQQPEAGPPTVERPPPPPARTETGI